MKLANFVNILLFLRQGTYPTLLHRMLKLQTELVQPDQPKSADMSMLTRELLWHSFAASVFFSK